MFKIKKRTTAQTDQRVDSQLTVFKKRTKSTVEIHSEPSLLLPDLSHLFPCVDFDDVIYSLKENKGIFIVFGHVRRADWASLHFN